MRDAIYVQAQGPARSQHACREESLGVPIFRRENRFNDVSDDLSSSLHKSKDGIFFLRNGYELRHRFSVFGDHDCFVLGVHFIDYGKAMCLELSSRHCLHAKSPTMVIIPWS